MYCHNCGKDILKDSKFCGNCGNKNINDSFSYKQEDLETCYLCGKIAPVKNVDLNANIGMLFMRRRKQMKGKLCKTCISNTFWNFTITNLFLGWWGVISFFATCAFMIGNIFQYLSSLSMKKVY